MHVPAPASENKPAEHGEHDVWPVLLWYWPAVQREQQALCPPLLVQQFGAVGGPTWPAGQFTHKLTALWYMPDVQSLPAQALAPAPVQNHTRTRTCNHAGHDQGVALKHASHTLSVHRRRDNHARRARQYASLLSEQHTPAAQAALPYARSAVVRSNARTRQLCQATAPHSLTDRHYEAGRNHGSSHSTIPTPM